ncbi:MAG: hypothetical protein IPI85_11935 [Dehalococcoidia bacterium]|nr:hypothetical protein [Dehalococcoidia bacterium]
MSTTVRLREPTKGDVPLLDAWNASLAFRGEFNDFGLPPRSAAEAAEKGFIDDQHGTLIVEADGTPVGTIDWRPASAPARRGLPVACTAHRPIRTQ